MECNCNNNNNGGVIPWVRGNRLPLVICVYEDVVTQEGEGSLVHNKMERVPYEIQAADTVTVVMKSGFRQVEMPFTTEGNKVLVTDNGELAAGTYTVEVTIVRGDGARGRWQETSQVRVYENTSDAQLGEMYSIDADLFFYAKGDTGTGISDITNNPDGTLTITMTDGTSYTTEALKGDKGDKGERGVSIVSFDVTGQTDVSVIYTVTFSDDTTQDISVPKGPQGDTGLTGNGISTTTLNSDYTLTIAYTDGTTYTTPSIRGAQGAQGVSVIGFTQTGETATNTMYNLVFSDGRTQSVAIPKGVKGDKGDTGNTGSQGAQGPKGDTVTATDYTLYNVQGADSNGAMSQDATTKAISAQTGYYTCGAAADKVDKVAAVENGNVYKRTLGGHFKVKMTNANTASGVTLQVGSETATTLWYNGAAVSATNTWEAGEIISVFYDGTRFMASNSQGGGGKAEKVSFNNSNSVLVSDNVQTALNEVGNAIFELSTPITIPAGTSTKQYYTYQNGSIVIGSSNNFRCWSPIDISKYYALRINFYLPVNANPAAAKTFFTDENDVMVGDFLYNTSGDYKEYIVPEGAKKLYWSTNYNIQSSVGLRGITRANKIDEKVDKKDFLLSLDAVENYAGKEYHNGAFSSVSNATCRKYDVAEFENIYVTTRWKSVTAGYYKVVFVDEENTTISQLFVNTADVDVTLTRQKVAVPSNAKYVYVNNRYGVGMPIVEIEGSGTAIEKKINKNSVKKEISILFIGNSLTQDAVTYVPLLLRELAPDLKFKIYIWYNGGYKLSQQLADFNNNVACDIFSVCEDGTSWANFNNSVTMASVLSTYKFDIVSIQEYFNYQEISDVTTFNSVVEYIENHYAYPFKVVTLFHQPKRDTPAVIFERTKAGNALFLKDTVAEDMIPSGIAIYRALSTSLDSLGDQGHLSPDGTHAQEGLPCMMQAYVTAMWILKQVGIPTSVNNASSIVDDSNYASINVPGPNLGTGVVVGTTEQVRLSQKVAIKAFKEGEYFVNANLTEYTT